MFFSHKIVSIDSKFRVLEIGPGADPHPRSDVFLELKMESEKDYENQFGHERKLVTDKRVVFYDGITFPFADKEFDYVICSHVLEHVPDVNGFLSELFRVAKGGYIEYPLITYEYLYNFDVHLNYLKFDGNTLRHQRKSESPLNHFRPVQNLFTATLIKGYDQFYRKIPEYFFEGFEWKVPFKIQHEMDLEKFVPDASTVPMIHHDLSKEYSFKALAKAIAGKVKK